MSGFWDSAWGWLLKCLGWILVFLAPVKATAATALFLVLGDLFFGTWASLKQGHPFSSDKLRRTPVKLLGYLAGIVFSHAAQVNLVPEIPLVSGMAGLIALTELTSLYEKLSIITGVPFADLVKKLFNKPTEQPPAEKPHE